MAAVEKVAGNGTGTSPILQRSRQTGTVQDCGLGNHRNSARAASETQPDENDRPREEARGRSWQCLSHKAGDSCSAPSRSFTETSHRNVTPKRHKGVFPANCLPRSELLPNDFEEAIVVQSCFPGKVREDRNPTGGHEGEFEDFPLFVGDIALL